MSRGELRELLAEAVRKRLGEGAILCGARVESFRHEAGCLMVSYRDRATGERQCCSGSRLKQLRKYAESQGNHKESQGKPMKTVWNPG